MTGVGGPSGDPGRPSQGAVWLGSRGEGRRGCSHLWPPAEPPVSPRSPKPPALCWDSQRPLHPAACSEVLQVVGGPCEQAQRPEAPGPFPSPPPAADTSCPLPLLCWAVLWSLSLTSPLSPSPHFPGCWVGGVPGTPSPCPKRGPCCPRLTATTAISKSGHPNWMRGHHPSENA